MSNFLINHFARSVVKTARSQPKGKTSQLNTEQDQWTIAWKALGLGILFLLIIVAAIIFLLFLVM